MRIIGGIYKKKRLQPPRGIKARPTTDQAKEGLFNILEGMVDIEETNVLDLFAGTGNISFEFASRGAPRIIAVEKDSKCIQFISRTASELNLETLYTIRSDAMSFINRTQDEHDLIFADPPYTFDRYDELVNAIHDRGILNQNGILVVEHEKFQDLSELKGWYRSKKYGRVCFSFFKFDPEKN